MRDDGSQMGAILSLSEELGWHILPGPCFRAKPSGRVEDDVLVAFLDSLIRAFAAASKDGLDAVFLFLHGAMVTVSEDDVAGRVVSEVRQLAGSALPVAVVIDPHANVSPRLASLSNLLFSYRKNPHTDAVETAIQAAGLLNRVIREKLRTEVLHWRFPVVWPPTGTASADRPLQPLLDQARRTEGEDILRVNVCPGFAHADTPDTGLSITIVHLKGEGRPPGSEELIRPFRRLVQDGLREGFPAEWDLGQAVETALSCGEFPCLLVEPSDNVGGGAPGDGTWVLQHLIERGARGSGVVLCDPEAVKIAWPVLEGETIPLVVGGKSGPLAGGPVVLRARIVRKTNGSFSVEDKNNHTVGAGGHVVRMGPTVLLESQGIWILLNSIKTMPSDLGQWRCVGINPEELMFIGIKAAVAHRRAYAPIARQSYTISTPGPCGSDLEALLYHKLQRPIFPLDPVEFFDAVPAERS